MPPGIIMLYGANASGKTSALEAFYILGTGRSFRTHQVESVIRHNAGSLAVSGQLFTKENTQVSLGVIRQVPNRFSAKIAGKRVRATSELADWLPLQLITPDSLALITQGSDKRRNFLDLGLFHMEPSFRQHWQQYKKYLKQRNSWLKNCSDQPDDLLSWEHGLAQAGETITLLRKKYLDVFVPVFQQYVRRLLGDLSVSLRFSQGWGRQHSLKDALALNRTADKAVGHTRWGPHRADLAVLVDDYQAKNILSRGQEKLLVCAMKFAQEKVLREEVSKHSIFLVDDLASELDDQHLGQVLAIFREFDAQCVITALDVNSLNKMTRAVDSYLDEKSGQYWAAMFHMEHGKVVHAS